MNLSTWSIARPAPVILLFSFLTVLGLKSFSSLPVQNQPDIDVPTVTVSVGQAGAAAGAMETEVTRILEDSLATLAGIDRMTSSIIEGASTTTVEFELSKNSQEAVNDVRDAVSRIRGQLPAAITEPVISRMTVAGRPVVTFAIASDELDELALSWLVDDRIGKLIRTVPGVGKVLRQGGESREIQVVLMPEKLQALNVSVAELSTQLTQMHVEAAAGRSNLGAGEQSIRALGRVKDASLLANQYVSLSDGRKLRLGDIAEIRDTAAERRQQAYLNGKPVVSFQVYRSLGYSDVEVADAVRTALKKFDASRPAETITEISNSTDQVKGNYKSSMSTLYEGSILAVLVVFLFLRDWRATIVSAVALPLSVIPTFYFMQLGGFTLNGITLLALTLVVGVLVDDAIVEVENIVQHLNKGLSPLEAAKEAATEIGVAVIATTFTLVAVFLPTAFMGGIPGKFFLQFGWTVAISVLVSLLVARMVTPLMAANFLKAVPAPHAEPAWLTWYGKRLDWVVIHPLKTLGLALVFFVGSLALLPFLETGFIPRAKLGQLPVTLELPPGSSFAETNAATLAATKTLQSIPGVARVYATIGAGSEGSSAMGGGSSGEVRKATLTATVAQGADETQVEKAIRATLHVPGARLAFGQAMGETYTMVLRGDDADLLIQTAKRIEQDLRGLPGVGAVTSSAGLVQPELVLQIDTALAAQYGVATASVAKTVRVATAGDTDTALAKLSLPARQIGIRVQLPVTFRSDLEALKQLKVPAREGSVPLGTIAHMHLAEGPAQINRYDRSRNVTLTVELAGQALGQVARKANDLPSVRALPAGVEQVAGGDMKRMGELMKSFGGAMLLGIFCVFAVLVLLLHSFVHPFAILSALPLAAGGAFAGLLASGYPLSLPSLIGLLMLMGVVTKNSILLIDYGVLAMAKGLSPAAAMRDAGLKRARPILMTSIAMVAGMIPLLTGWSGGDPGFRAPMAATVIGGLITSTLLSLLVVPAVFIALAQLSSWVKIRIFQRG